MPDRREARVSQQRLDLRGFACFSCAHGHGVDSEIGVARPFRRGLSGHGFGHDKTATDRQSLVDLGQKRPHRVVLMIVKHPDKTDRVDPTRQVVLPEVARYDSGPVCKARAVEPRAGRRNDIRKIEQRAGHPGRRLNGRGEERARSAADIQKVPDACKAHGPQRFLGDQSLTVGHEVGIGLGGFRVGLGPLSEDIGPEPGKLGLAFAPEETGRVGKIPVKHGVMQDHVAQSRNTQKRRALPGKPKAAIAPLVHQTQRSRRPHENAHPADRSTGCMSQGVKGLWFVHQLFEDLHVQQRMEDLRMNEACDKIEKRLALGLGDASGEGKLAGPSLEPARRDKPVSPPSR